MDTPAPWLLEAGRLPVAFAQVREDAWIDLEVARRLAGGASVLMVASGGCTAAALATMQDLALLHFLDPNPAQLALTRLKLRLLQAAEPPERLALLGHAPCDIARRRQRLREELDAMDLAPGALGPPETVAELGPDHAG